MLNSITLYQIAKLGIIPCTCCVEYLLYGRVFTSKMVLAIVVTLMGVGLVSINELNYSDSTLGVFVALCSVVSSSGQQLLVRHLQLKHNVSAGQLLGVVAPAQGASLLLLSPVLDKLSTGGYVTDYDWTQGAMVCMALSCSAAVLVNVSQFLVLGRFTAVTYQVLGHAKTVCVLVVGYVFFGGVITGQQLGHGHGHRGHDGLLARVAERAGREAGGPGGAGRRVVARGPPPEEQGEQRLGFGA